MIARLKGRIEPERDPSLSYAVQPLWPPSCSLHIQVPSRGSVQGASGPSSHSLWFQLCHSTPGISNRSSLGAWTNHCGLQCSQWNSLALQHNAVWLPLWLQSSSISCPCTQLHRQLISVMKRAGMACLGQWSAVARLVRVSHSSSRPLLLCFQEGAFALVFKSIHYPGEAVATR